MVEKLLGKYEANSGGGKQIFDIDIYLRQFTRLVFHLFNFVVFG